MPLAFDPEQIVEHSLKSDADKPEPRPVFLFKHMTVRQAMTYRKCRDDLHAIWLEQHRREAAKEDVPVETIRDENSRQDNLIYLGLGLALVGYRNIGGAGEVRIDAPKELESVCTADEIYELFRDYPGAVVDAESKKKYGLPPQSSPAESAKDAPPAA